MEETKRKQLETRLRQLIDAAQQELPRPANQPGETGKVLVIRRRKGKPDRSIIEE